VAEAPSEIALGFLQKLNPKFTTIVVSDADKQKIPAADPAIKGPKATLKLNDPLPNGAYTVAYRVVSTDGHTVEGSYKFTVADKSAPSPAPSAAPSSAAPVVPSPSAAPPAEELVTASADSSGPGAGLIALLAAVVLLLAGAVFWLLKRRRAPSA
jgi:hypothetical protein